MDNSRSARNDFPAIRGLVSAIAAVAGANAGAHLLRLDDDGYLIMGVASGVGAYFVMRLFGREPGEPYIPRNLLDLVVSLAVLYAIDALVEAVLPNIPWRGFIATACAFSVFFALREWRKRRASVTQP